MGTPERYRRFAMVEAAGTSPSYQRLALGVAGDADVCALLDDLPAAKRQPNLLFAAARLVGGPTASWAAFRSFVLDGWPALAAVMAERSTQTNEAARCGVLLPVLAALPGPLALLEVGASAGLCLQPDRYRYDFDGATVGGSSGVHIGVRCDGDVPVPAAVPAVVWRAGIDLNPLDVTDPDDIAWLAACVWPEHDERLRRLEAAVEVAAREPPPLVAGDLLEGTEALIDDAPDDVTKIVFHSAVLAYLEPADRVRFGASMRRDDVVWISNEAPGVIDGPDPGPAAGPPAFAAAPAWFVIRRGVDAEPVALADPHGSWLSWL